jgi:hypothetical protein
MKPIEQLSDESDDEYKIDIGIRESYDSDDSDGSDGSDGSDK